MHKTELIALINEYERRKEASGMKKIEQIIKDVEADEQFRREVIESVSEEVIKLLRKYNLNVKNSNRVISSVQAKIEKAASESKV